MNEVHMFPLSAGAGPSRGSGTSQRRSRSGRPNANDHVWNQLERRKVCGSWTEKVVCQTFTSELPPLLLHFHLFTHLCFWKLFLKVPRRLWTSGGGMWLLLLQEPPEGVPSPPARDQWAAGQRPPHDPQHCALPRLLRGPQRSSGGGSAPPAEETHSVTRWEIRAQNTCLICSLCSFRSPQNWLVLGGKGALPWLICEQIFELWYLRIESGVRLKKEIGEKKCQ